MEYYSALRVAAMAAVVEPDFDAWMRHVQRSYSKWFCTPLHTVKELPMEDVVRAYYEQSFEEMDETERQFYLDRLSETEEETAIRIATENKQSNSDDALVERLNKEIEEDMKSSKVTKEQAASLQGNSVESAPSKEEPLINMTFDDNL